MGIGFGGEGTSDRSLFSAMVARKQTGADGSLGRAAGTDSQTELEPEERSDETEQTGKKGHLSRTFQTCICSELSM